MQPVDNLSKELVEEYLAEMDAADGEPDDDDDAAPATAAPSVSTPAAQTVAPPAPTPAATTVAHAAPTPSAPITAPVVPALNALNDIAPLDRPRRESRKRAAPMEEPMAPACVRARKQRKP